MTYAKTGKNAKKHGFGVRQAGPPKPKRGTWGVYINKALARKFSRFQGRYVVANDVTFQIPEHITTAIRLGFEEWLDNLDKIYEGAVIAESEVIEGEREEMGDALEEEEA